jgi:DNA-directed RNA polymerase subunit RPC12/RpoP
MIYGRDFRDLKGMFCPECGSKAVIKEGIVNPIECW